MSLLDVVPNAVPAEFKPAAPSSSKTSARRKPKPYEQLKALNNATAEKKAEKKAIKSGKTVKKATRPNGKLSKASLKVAKRTAAVKTLTGKGANTKLNKQDTKSTTTGVCTFCGKPLSRHSSVSAGMGDTCAQKKALLKGLSIEDHMATMTVYDEPGADYLKIGKAIEQARKKGVSGYRFLIAIGGDRMLRKPLNKHFQVVIYKGTRYVPKSSLSHLKDIEPV